MIRQYRHASGGHVWKLPAGLLDVDGEPPWEAAARELAEEVDLTADEWHVLADDITSPGAFPRDGADLLARRLQEVAAADAHQRTAEELSLRPLWVSLDDAVDAASPAASATPPRSSVCSPRACPAAAAGRRCGRTTRRGRPARPSALRGREQRAAGDRRPRDVPVRHGGGVCRVLRRAARGGSLGLDRRGADALTLRGLRGRRCGLPRADVAPEDRPDDVELDAATRWTVSRCPDGARRPVTMTTASSSSSRGGPKPSAGAARRRGEMHEVAAASPSRVQWGSTSTASSADASRTPARQPAQRADGGRRLDRDRPPADDRDSDAVQQHAAHQRARGRAVARRTRRRPRPCRRPERASRTVSPSPRV